MKQLTYEQSVIAAAPVKEMAELARKLDVEYLTQALEGMRSTHSLRESAMILNPNPFTAMEQSELEAEKLKGLELMIQLAKNQERIFELTVKLEIAKQNTNDLSKLFGL